MSCSGTSSVTAEVRSDERGVSVEVWSGERGVSGEVWSDERGVSDTTGVFPLARVLESRSLHASCLLLGSFPINQCNDVH